VVVLLLAVARALLQAVEWTSAVAGSLQEYVGRSTVNTGGSIAVSSCEGTVTSSGIISILTTKASTSGSSGMLIFGSSSTGANKIGTGAVCSGQVLLQDMLVEVL